jgi:hypothetical protein
MIYRFSRCQMPMQGPALLPNLLRQCKPGSPWPASTYNNHRHLIPRRRSSYFDIRSRHFNVNFCPAITGADALDLELAFPHMAHASDLSEHDWRYIGGRTAHHLLCRHTSDNMSVPARFWSYMRCRSLSMPRMGSAQS